MISFTQDGRVYMKFLAQGTQPHPPINIAGLTGAMRVKFLVQGNNNVTGPDEH